MVSCLGSLHNSLKRHLNFTLNLFCRCLCCCFRLFIYPSLLFLVVSAGQCCCFDDNANNLFTVLTVFFIDFFFLFLSLIIFFFFFHFFHRRAYLPPREPASGKFCFLFTLCQHLYLTACHFLFGWKKITMGMIKIVNIFLIKIKK